MTLPSFIVLWATTLGLLVVEPLINPYTFVAFQK
jgi:hypothetical protein